MSTGQKWSVQLSPFIRILCLMEKLLLKIPMQCNADKSCINAFVTNQCSKMNNAFSLSTTKCCCLCYKIEQNKHDKGNRFRSRNPFPIIIMNYFSNTMFIAGTHSQVIQHLFNNINCYFTLLPSSPAPVLLYRKWISTECCPIDCVSDPLRDCRRVHIGSRKSATLSYMDIPAQKSVSMDIDVKGQRSISP